jgi:hypothetical protein
MMTQLYPLCISMGMWGGGDYKGIPISPPGNELMNSIKILPENDQAQRRISLSYGMFGIHSDKFP